MILTVDGEARELLPIRQFRAAHNLPSTFGSALFEPKITDDLGSLERPGAGAALQTVRTAILNAIPSQLTLFDWLNYVPQLTKDFRHTLEAINDRIGLRESELDFAAAGFGDVVTAHAYALIRAYAAHTPTPDFESVYRDWLMGTLRIATHAFCYDHQGDAWTIRVIVHAYGRVGLQITLPLETLWVADGALSCPAEGYMTTLLADVAEVVEARLLP